MRYFFSRKFTQTKKNNNNRNEIIFFQNEKLFLWD